MTHLRPPYGSWPSPITAADVVVGTPRIDGARFVAAVVGDGTADEIWWSEQIASEGGRTAILAGTVGALPFESSRVVLPAPWSARSRVNEYGGGAWTTSPDGTLVFVEASDQRVWLMRLGGEPVPLTPSRADTRYGDLVWGSIGVLAVRERDLAGGGCARDIVLIAPDEVGGDGQGTDDGAGVIDEPISVVDGADFFAYPTPSPGCERLAWIAWNHPAMPWDETRLMVGTVDASGRVDDAAAVAGGPRVSVLQPEWLGDERLAFASDRSGRWNLETALVGDALSSDLAVSSDERSDDDRGEDASPRASTSLVAPVDADTGGPLWNLGARWYAPLERGGFFAVRTNGRDELVVIDDSGDATPINSGVNAFVLVRDVVGDRVLITGSGGEATAGLWLVDASATPATVTRLRGGVAPVDPAWLPNARAITGVGELGPVHAYLYPPTNPDILDASSEAASTTREAPPALVLVHGGPTAHVAGDASMAVAYFTSRGIAVVDVNYAGSTGYGRAYRERLNGRWGEADVADVVTIVEAAAREGAIDAERVAIRGGSAGGWTVLRALTTTSAFAAGISRYGVADLRTLAADTHDFESRYLDGLVGPLPEAESRYIELSPLSHLEDFRAPMLIEQGLDDRVVPPAQSEAVRDALAARGIPHAYLAFAGEGHGFRRSETIIASLEAELSFLGQVFGFDTPGVVPLKLVTE